MTAARCRQFYGIKFFYLFSSYYYFTVCDTVKLVKKKTQNSLFVSRFISIMGEWCIIVLFNVIYCILHSIFIILNILENIFKCKYYIKWIVSNNTQNWHNYNTKSHFVNLAIIFKFTSHTLKLNSVNIYSLLKLTEYSIHIKSIKIFLFEFIIKFTDINLYFN